MSKFKLLDLKKNIKIVIILLAVLSFSIAGYYVWQNFFQSNRNKNDADTTRTQDVKIVLSESTTDTSHGSGLAIKYPKSWKVANAGDYERYIKENPDAVVDPSDTAAKNPDNVTITSPDDKVSVIFDVGNRPELDQCYADDDNQVLEKIVTNNISGYDDYVLVTSVVKDVFAESYYYTIGVFKSGDWTNSVKVGDQQCVIGSQGIIFKDLDGNNAVILAKIVLNDVKNYDKTTLANVNKAVETDNFNIAKQIIQSLYVKK